MTAKLKMYLGRKVIESVNKTMALTPTQLIPLMQVGQTKSENDIEMNLPLTVLENQLGIPNVSHILKIKPDDIIEDIKVIKDRADRRVSFKIKKDIFVKEVLLNCTDRNERIEKSKKIVVEYSSPNVAKPFHMGHLRSTIIGNFVANIHDYLNNDVVRLNYLGDWGTQFGFIRVGIDELKIPEEEIRNNPMKMLYESYVYANKLAESNPLILEKAKEEFHKLEQGSEKDINTWKQYINYTINDLRTTYDRLGVFFDEYNCESMYGANKLKDLIENLHKRKILEKQVDGKVTATVNDKKVSLLKSDGSTLYLTRDIAAALDRFKKYNFDHMYYVVDSSQSDHFKNMINILYQMDLPWACRLHHVKFGRVRGMSTRKGNAIFLSDILNESKELMVKKQIESPTTKAPITNTEVSDTLGVSCVIINDLKQRRQKDYDFDWDKVLQDRGDTGVKLHYTHCRLCNLEKNCGATPAPECVPEVLSQPEAILLVKELARFHETLFRARDQLEACILVNYLFNLCNHINRALKVLRVKDQDPLVASQRLLLFNTSREVLRQGMSILGLKPLKEM